VIKVTIPPCNIINLIYWILLNVRNKNPYIMHYGAFPETISDEVRRMAMTIIKDCMGVKPGESVLIVTDNIRKDLGLPIYQAALEAGNDAIYMEMKPRKTNGEEPPKMVADAMYDADVIIAITRVSLTHTDAKIRAVEHGARIATMPFGSGSTEFVSRIFTQGGMAVDYKRMNRNIHRLAGRINGSKQAHVMAEKGTDVVIDFGGREFREDSGIAHDPGDFTNLPAGELYIAPVSANGIIVVDVTMGRLGRLKSPLTLEVKDGTVYSIRGERGKEVESILGEFGPKAMNLAEFGIGMNPNARICGLLVEDEKVGNTVHFAMGNNAGFGGDVDVDIHMDGVVSRPVIYIDGEKLNMDEYL
jgi:aminopeptidase